MSKKTIFLIYMLVLFFPFLEMAFRILGYRPYEQLPFSIESKPEFCIIPNSYVGFALQPGKFEVNINQGLEYSVVHTDDSLRNSSKHFIQKNLPQIFIMGCSYTYGWGLDDSSTFSYLLQNKLPEYRIRNFGVPGFGTVQSYLQLQREIERGQIPKQVIVNYADFHDERNALIPVYRKHLYMGFERSNKLLSEQLAQSNIPHLVQKGDTYQIGWVPWGKMYANWRGREKFALINFLQDGIDRISSQNIDAPAYSLSAFQMIQQLCAKHDIQLLVSGLAQTSETQDMLQALDRMHIKTIDISVDLSLPAFTNYPFDTHPNASAHKVFAEKLFPLIPLTH